MIDRGEIRVWLQTEGLSVEELTAPDGAWVLVTRYPAQNGASIQLTLGASDSSLRVGRRTSVAPKHIAALRNLSPDDFVKLNFTIVRDLLLARRVNYAFAIDIPAKEFRHFDLGRELREDQLTRGALMDALHDIHDMTILVTILVRRAAGDTT